MIQGKERVLYFELKMLNPNQLLVLIKNSEMSPRCTHFYHRQGIEIESLKIAHLKALQSKVAKLINCCILKAKKML